MTIWLKRLLIGALSVALVGGVTGIIVKLALSTRDARNPIPEKSYTNLKLNEELGINCDKAKLRKKIYEYRQITKNLTFDKNLQNMEAIWSGLKKANTEAYEKFNEIATFTPLNKKINNDKEKNEKNIINDAGGTWKLNENKSLKDFYIYFGSRVNKNMFTEWPEWKNWVSEINDSDFSEEAKIIMNLSKIEIAYFFAATSYSYVKLCIIFEHLSQNNLICENLFSLYNILAEIELNINILHNLYLNQIQMNNRLLWFEELVWPLLQNSLLLFKNTPYILGMNTDTKAILKRDATNLINALKLIDKSTGHMYFAMPVAKSESQVIDDKPLNYELEDGWSTEVMYEEVYKFRRGIFWIEEYNQIQMLQNQMYQLKKANVNAYDGFDQIAEIAENNIPESNSEYPSCWKLKPGKTYADVCNFFIQHSNKVFPNWETWKSIVDINNKNETQIIYEMQELYVQKMTKFAYLKMMELVERMHLNKFINKNIAMIASILIEMKYNLPRIFGEKIYSTTKNSQKYYKQIDENRKLIERFNGIMEQIPYNIESRKLSLEINSHTHNPCVDSRTKGIPFIISLDALGKTVLIIPKK